MKEQKRDLVPFSSDHVLDRDLVIKMLRHEEQLATGEWVRLITKSLQAELVSRLIMNMHLIDEHYMTLVLIQAIRASPIIDPYFAPITPIRITMTTWLSIQVTICATIVVYFIALNLYKLVHIYPIVDSINWTV